MADDQTVTMSDRLTPKYEDENENYILGGSIESEDDALIQTDIPDEKLKTLVQGNELAFRLIQKWSTDPVDKGWKVKTEDDIDLDKQVRQHRQRLQFDSKLMDLNKFVNVFGSAAFGYDLLDSAQGPGQEADPEDVSDILGINIIRQEQVEDYEVDDDGEIEYYDLEEQYDHDKIHSSRIYHARYYYIDGHPEGHGLLTPLYTSFKVFENVKFGMGQAFYVGGTGFPVLEVNNLENMSDKDAGELRDEFMSDILKNPGMIIDKEKTDLSFQGSQGKALDPEPYVESLMKIIGSAVGGKQVLTGAEPGGVEGSQTNKEEYFGDVSSFQKNKQTPIVRDFVQRLIDYGMVEEPDSGFRIEWEPLFELSEEKKAEISETKSKAFMNLTASGVPAEVAAEEVGLDDETIEALQEDEGEESGSEGSQGNSNNNSGSGGGSGPEPQGNEGTEGDPENLNDDDYDPQKTKRTIRILKDQEGFDSDSYFAQDDSTTDQEVTKPTTWNQEVYSQYQDLRDTLQDEVFEQFIEDMIEAVDAATIESGSDADSWRDRVQFWKSNDDQRSLSEFTLSQRMNDNLDKLEENAKEATRDSLKGAFAIGADEAAEEFNVQTSKIFDKHRKELLDQTFDQYITPAYKNTTDKVADDVNAAVRKHFNEQDHGIDDLKRDIRALHGQTDTSLDYRFDRIARTETARIRNVSYIDESSRRGRNSYEWIGPTDQRTTEICLNIKSGNPYTKKQIMDATAGGLPHINCRHTAAVNNSAILGDVKDEADIPQLHGQFRKMELNLESMDLDQTINHYRNTSNMDLEEMERWTSQQSSDSEIADKTLRLKKTPVGNWEDEDLLHAGRSIFFINMARQQEGEDGFSDRDKRLMKNWGYDPEMEQ